MAYRSYQKTSTLYCPKIIEGTQGLLHFFQEVLAMANLHNAHRFLLPGLHGLEVNDTRCVQQHENHEYGCHITQHEQPDPEPACIQA